MNRSFLVATMFLCTLLSNGQKVEVSKCDVLNCFLNDSIAIRFFALNRTADILHVIDTVNQIQGCDTLITSYQRLVVMERKTNLLLKPDVDLGKAELSGWENHLWLEDIRTMDGRYSISFYWKINNGQMTIRYRLKNGHLVRIKSNSGYF